MRRAAAILAVPLTAALGPACTSPGDDPGPPIPIEPAALYAQSCARCHGSDGRGEPQIRQQIPVRDFTDPAFRARLGTEEIERVVMSGRGQMPSFGGVLSPPKIQALAGHVRRLAMAGAARARTGPE